MPDKETRRGILRIFQTPRKPRNPTPLPPYQPMRTPEEHAPAVEKVTCSAEIMKRLAEVIGSDDEERGRAAIDEVRNFAQTLDPTISYAEGARIALLLAEKVWP